MSKDIVAKVDDIIEGKNLSKSRIDRLMEPTDLLMDYLSTHLSRIKQTDPMIDHIKQDFLDNYDNLSDGSKLRLLELLLKKETDDNTPLINMFAKALEVKKEKDKEDKNNQGNTPSTGNNSSFTQEDMTQAKKFLKQIEVISKGEFSKEEK